MGSPGGDEAAIFGASGGVLGTIVGRFMHERPAVTRVLVADRRGGALRVRRWGRETGVEVVALSAQDEDEQPWLEHFDFTVAVRADGWGRWPDARSVIGAMHDGGCDALHPGWGQASQSPLLVEQLMYAGVAWAGPGREALGLALDRGISLIRATELGIPVVPHSGPLSDLDVARSWVTRVGFPVRIRPVDIEIGHPRPVLRSFEDFETSMPRWLRIGPCVLERQVAGAREIEVPVLVDGRGEALAIGDRDVTVRDGRRHLLVEAPAPGLDDKLRAELAESAVAFALALDWRGLGTVRFLLAPDGRPYLLQLRPGLQPWHGATEVAFDVDLVDAQMRLAIRDVVRWTEADIRPRRAAIWAGVTAAESGTVGVVDGGGLRVDLDVVPGEQLRAGAALAGVVSAAPHRQAAIVRLRAWLDGDHVEGVSVNRAALDAMVGSHRFWLAPLDRDEAAAVAAGTHSEA